MGCILQFFLIVTFFSVSEVYLLLYVAQHTSLLFTIACCAFTGIAGSYFVRQQGLRTLAKIKQTLESGVIPADEAIEALLLLIVGILLCVPGFITDSIGFLIIIPGIRNIVAKHLLKRFTAEVSGGNFKIYTATSSPENSDKENSVEENLSINGEIENATIIENTENDDS